MGPSVREGHGIGRHRRRGFGMHGISLTQSTMGLCRQALKRFGRIGAVALGLRRHGWSRQIWLGPSDVQHDEEPHENASGELVVKKRRDHGLAPSTTGEDGGLGPGFEANGIITG